MSNFWNKVKSIATGAAILGCSLALTACGKTSYAGTYQASYDYTEMAKEQLEADSIEGTLAANYTLVLEDDNTFTFSFDVDSYKEDLATLLTNNIDAYFASVLTEEGYTEDQFEDIAVNSGYESYAAMKQTYLDSMIQALSSVADTQNSTTSGTYSVSDGTITLSYNDNVDAATESDDADEVSEYDTVTINEDGTLTMTVSDLGEDATLTFTKVDENAESSEDASTASESTEDATEAATEATEGTSDEAVTETTEEAAEATDAATTEATDAAEPEASDESAAESSSEETTDESTEETSESAE